MDPIGAVAAILQISKNAYALGQYIHKIYEGAKRIDESVISLANEVHALANSCGLVYDELRLILDQSGTGVAESRYDTDGRLGRCVDQQVVQCDNTLKELAKIIDNLWPRNTTLFERASKQIDLQNSHEKLNGIRQHLMESDNGFAYRTAGSQHSNRAHCPRPCDTPTSYEIGRAATKLDEH